MKLALLGGLAAMALPAVAQAHWRGGLGLSFGIGISPAYSYPAYCAPRYYYPPAYVAPAYVPPPVVYAPPPVVYDPPAVVYGPPPVVYDAPVVVYGPSISTGFFFGGHGGHYFGHTHYGYRHR